MDVDAVGIISPGEMGSRLGRLFREHAIEPITTVTDRSPRTRRLAADAGFTVVDDLETVVESTDLICSTVPTGAATTVVDAVSDRARTLGTRVLLCDLNPVDPRTMERLESSVGNDIDLVDGCIIGPARAVPAVRVYLSGPAAPKLEWFDDLGIDVTILGDGIGQASGFKLCYGGLSKGVASLGLDILLAARALDIEEPLVALQRQRMPGIVDHLDAYLPRTPARAWRWAEEMDALAATFDLLTIDGSFAMAGHDRLDWLADLGIDSPEFSDAIETTAAIYERAVDPP